MVYQDRDKNYIKIAAFPSPEDFSKYSDITETQLDAVVQRVKQEHPNDGEVLIAGHLLKEGVHVQRSKLRRSIHRIDPTGVAKRRSVAVRRRAYHVISPNEV